MIFSLAQQFIVCSYIAILKSDLTAWNRKHLDANNITTMSNAQIIDFYTQFRLQNSPFGYPHLQGNCDLTPFSTIFKQFSSSVLNAGMRMFVSKHIKRNCLEGQKKIEFKNNIIIE